MSRRLHASESHIVKVCKFTGKERDGETGMDYFGARYYANTMGRWMSPDWSAAPTPVPYADFSDPQTLNLYGYVRNNPTTLTDPDGHLPDWVKKIGCQLGASSQCTPEEQEKRKKQEQEERERYEKRKYDWEKKHPGRSYKLYLLSLQLQFMPMAGFSVVGEAGTAAEGAAQGAIEGTSRIWPSAAHGPRIINGIEYTEHALEQMTPVGMGRGVPPSVVENAIQFGAKTAGNKPDTIVNTFENVIVVTDSSSKVVITVIKRGH